MNDDSLKKAREEEMHHFESFYLWLQKSMPSIFFKEVPAEWITLIVHGLMSFKVQDFFVEIHLREGAITLCFDSPAADMNILKSYPLHGIKNYTTYISKNSLPLPENPGLLRVAILYFTDAKKDLSDEMDASFLRKLSINQKERALHLFQEAKRSDACQYECFFDENWKEKETTSAHLILAWKNVPKHNFLYRLARVVYQHGLTMKKVNASYIKPNTTESILLLSFGLHGNEGQSAFEATDFDDFLQEISLLKYFGSLDLIEETFVIPGLLRGNLANLLRTTLHFIHQVLVHVDPNLYSIENVEEGLTRLPELTIKLCEAFENKFHPGKRDMKKFEALRGEFYLLVKQLDTGHEQLDARRKNVLLQGMNFIDHILKTNFYCPDKTSIAFRLDPAYLNFAPFDRKSIFPELPYGIFFFKGMHYQGFHVRFRDLARGGLRTIFPERKERVIAERNNVFLECYHLAYTQHKKNKDIPESGAKGVIFLKPNERLEEEALIYRQELQDAEIDFDLIEKKISLFKEEQKIEYLHQTQRSYIETLLSLVNYDNEGKLRNPHVIDDWGRPENIFLGPDENMHTVIIDWIAQMSKSVCYRPGGAFISGKSNVGLHHKEYGVTSLGVNVYMHELLLYLGIDPYKEKFTVKMTGGPDGDVAGNQILNLLKYYPHTAKLIALTDVSGTIHDPSGLDLETCAELFKKESPIRNYPPGMLSSGGFLLDRMQRREMTPYVFQTLCYRKRGEEVFEEWLQGHEMNTLFRLNVHQTKTDLFLPCGGRPRTLRKENISEFFDAAGKPTSKGIVEGANLYFSHEARSYLEENGVLIIKDSSANKCGVISSSFEILAGLTLSDEEFIAHRERIVSDILERLKEVALQEAKLLIETHKSTKKPLSLISDQISEGILFYTDEILAYLEDKTVSEGSLKKCFLDYCLSFLREHYTERLMERIPEGHKKAIIASHIAARLIYKKGLFWKPSIAQSLPSLIDELIPSRI